MEPKMKSERMEGMAYKKFWIMMIISFIVMYIVMFLNMDAIGHYHTSLTRIYMALLMVTPMALVMVMLMSKMYPNKKMNVAIIITSLVIFVVTLIALRTQVPVSDIQYMKAMIPHHSSAIMTSKNAAISDTEVKKLSEQIIRSQEKEIAEMEALIKKLEGE